MNTHLRSFGSLKEVEDFRLTTLILNIIFIYHYET